MIESKSGTRFDTRASEISDVEIHRHFGTLIDAAIRAFQTDVTYLVDMATRANQISSRRPATA